MLAVNYVPEKLLWPLIIKSVAIMFSIDINEIKFYKSRYESFFIIIYLLIPVLIVVLLTLSFYSLIIYSRAVKKVT
jgi:hypothetical protein